MKGNTIGKTLTVNADRAVIAGLLQARGIDVDPEVAASRYVRYMASEESVDSMGDVIRSDAWDVSEWLKNPAMFADHKNSVASMVARGLNAQVIGKQLIVDAFFLPPDLDATGLAEACYKLCKAGILPDCSVGFRAKSGGWRWATDADRVTWKGATGIYTAVSLKELSCVGVGAHPSAKVEAVAKGLRDGSLSDADVRALQGNEATVELVERALFRLSGPTAQVKAIEIPETVAPVAPDFSPVLDAIAVMGKRLASMERKAALQQTQKAAELGIFLTLESAQAIATYAEAIAEEIEKYIPEDEDEPGSDGSGGTPAPDQSPVAPPYEEDVSKSKSAEASALETVLKQFKDFTTTTTGAQHG